jgi:hypothetical protein
MKHCGREADRKARAAESACRALEKDCKNELSPAFLDRIRRNLSDPQQKLFAEGLAASCASATVEQGGQVMEQSVLAHLSRREACGQDPRTAALGAIADAVSSRKSSQLRAMEGHWLKKGGVATVPAVQAAKQALQTVSSVDLASKILDGQLLSVKANRPKAKGDLDEDLRADRSTR